MSLIDSVSYKVLQKGDAHKKDPSNGPYFKGQVQFQSVGVCFMNTTQQGKQDPANKGRIG